MGNDKKKIAEKKRGKKITASQKKKVEEIIREAEEAEPMEIPDNHGELETKIKESESKGMLLAEALHSSRGQLEKLAGPSKEGEERAMPFGPLVRYGNDDDGVNLIIVLCGRDGHNIALRVSIA